MNNKAIAFLDPTVTFYAGDIRIQAYSVNFMLSPLNAQQFGQFGPYTYVDEQEPLIADNK